MKIAFINVYQNQVERGAEVFIHEIAKRLSKKHDVTVYSYSNKIPKRIPVLWKLFLDPQGLTIGYHALKILPDLRKQKYDVIIPTNGGWQPTIVRLFTFIFGGKVIISGQSGKGWDDKNNLWNFPDCFVALTKESANWAKSVNPFVNVISIPNGVDLKKFTTNKNNLFSKLEEPIILTVGALGKDKRQDLAIKSVSKMKKGSLVIIGKGREKDNLNKLGKKLLKHRFLIAEYPHEKITEVYQSADIFTYPTSSAESFGIVLVEAMASGLPVVATDDPIRKEIVGNAGMFVDPNNIDEYSASLEKALNSNWGNEPRKQAEKYSWDKIALQYEKLFESIIKND